MTKWGTSRSTHRKGTWSRAIWPRFPSLDLGVGCWIFKSPGYQEAGIGLRLRATITDYDGEARRGADEV